MTAKISGDGSIFLTERASAAGDVAGDGQIWVDNAVPNTLFFTNDAGTDEQLSGLGYQSVVQVVNVTDSAVATGTTVMPSDDTIPQNNEGIEFMTLAITPTSATNKLKIEVVFQNWISAQNVAVVALFQDTTANALATGKSYQPGGDRDAVISFSYIMTSGTTSATTFKVRAGVNSGGTTAMNGRSGAIHGGALSSSITIIEYEA